MSEQVTSELGQILKDAVNEEGLVYMAVGRKELPLCDPGIPPQRLGAFYKTKIDQWVKEQK